MNRQALVALCALAALFFLGLGAVPLFEPDEGRYTEIPREMLASRDFVLPHLNGVLYFEKPPLFYWLTAAAQRVWGLTAFASRFWSATLGLFGVLATFAMGARTRSRRSGWLAAAVLATSPLYLALSHLAIIDVTLCFFFSCTLMGFFLAQNEPPDSPRERWFWFATFAAAGMTVLAKGLIGIVLPVGVAVLFLVFSRRFHALRRIPWMPGAAIFLVIAAPWHILAALRNPHFFHFYIVREHFLRYLTTVHDRVEPWWFFLPVLLFAMLLWVAFLSSSLRNLFRGAGSGEHHFQGKELELFLWLWAGAVVVFFSLSHSKLIPYVLPALPPLALLAGLELDRGWEDLLRAKWLRIVLFISLLTSAGLGALFLVAGAGRLHAFETREILWPLLISALAGMAFVLAASAFVMKRDLRRLTLALACAAASIFACAWTAGPVLAAGRDVRALAALIREKGALGDLVFSYRFYPQCLPVYLERPIGVVGMEGELAFGIGQLDAPERLARFPSPAEFGSLWDSPRRIWLVTDRDSLKKMEGDGLAHAQPVAENHHVCLLTNWPLDGARSP